MKTLQSKHEILVCDDAAELAREAARRFSELADLFVTSSGRFTVALSGGSTPKAMFSLLAEAPYAGAVPWDKIYFFWGDERCVPPDHPDSNYRMTRETLLAKVGVPMENIFRVQAEDPDPDHAASLYSDIILNTFAPKNAPPSPSRAIDFPRFDLIFLGMGADGHTASLFPGTSALKVDNRIVVANYVDKFKAFRITLTASTINSARNILFLIGGEDKAPALKEVLEGARNPSLYPSQLIEPHFGSLLWMVDWAAASLLSK
jgi:6-phosphogluconolactonase